MTIRRIEPQEYLASATVHGGIAYVSGLAATDISQDIAGQTRQALDETDRVLALAGTSKSHLLRVEVWLADIGEFDAMNAVYMDWLDPAAIPARVCVQSALWDKAAKVEIMVTAVVPD